jgi:hypothetical protein
MSVSEKRSVIEGDQLLAEDRRILRKVDHRLLPVFTLLYLLSFLDRFVFCFLFDTWRLTIFQRSNIGNAKYAMNCTQVLRC